MKDTPGINGSTFQITLESNWFSGPKYRNFIHKLFCKWLPRYFKPIHGGDVLEGNYTKLLVLSKPVPVLYTSKNPWWKRLLGMPKFGGVYGYKYNVKILDEPIEPLKY